MISPLNIFVAVFAFETTRHLLMNLATTDTQTQNRQKNLPCAPGCNITCTSGVGCIATDDCQADDIVSCPSVCLFECGEGACPAQNEDNSCNCETEYSDVCSSTPDTTTPTPDTTTPTPPPPPINYAVLVPIFAFVAIPLVTASAVVLAGPLGIGGITAAGLLRNNTTEVEDCSELGTLLCRARSGECCRLFEFRGRIVCPLSCSEEQLTF